MATPIKAIILPFLLKQGETATEKVGVSARVLFSISGHRNWNNFRSGLSKLVERNFLSVDKSQTPHRFYLTPRGTAHAKDSALALKEAREARRRILGLDAEPEPVKVKVSVKRKVRKATERVEPEPAKAPEAPVTLEEELRQKLHRGPLTLDDIRLMTREHDYFTIRDHLREFIKDGTVVFDIDAGPAYRMV